MPSSCSAASSGASSPRISPITRLRHARHVHEQLQQRKQLNHNVAIDHQNNQYAALPDAKRFHVGSVQSLAMELQQLSTKDHDIQQDQAASSAHHRLQQRVEKIGSREKDELVVYLLQQIDVLKTQRDDVAAVGEQLTTRLVEQQHALRSQFKLQSEQLQQQLHSVTYNHPDVAKLQQTITSLEATNRENEQKLVLAMQRLHRSRQRERALRRESEDSGHPLLWDL